MGINHGCGQRENAFARFCFASLVAIGRHDSNNITGAGRGAIDAISLRSIKALRFFIRGTFLCWGVYEGEASGAVSHRTKRAHFYDFA